MVDKLDWKFAIVLILHLLAVGAMYGRITTEVSTMGAAISELKEDVKRVKATTEDTSRSVAIMVEKSKDNSERIKAIEQFIWRPNNAGREERGK